MISKQKVTIYIFDTSAFSALHRQHTQVIEMPQQIWDWLAEEMSNGHVLSHQYVYEEVVSESTENADMMTKWLLPKKSCFEKGTAERYYSAPNSLTS